MIKTKILVFALAWAAVPALVHAQPAWPSRPVTLVVGYGAGGTTDILARALSEELGKQTGQTFVVENKPGANSNIGTEWVSRANPDGYTLLVGSTANSINNSLYKGLRFDLRKNFTPLARIGSVPNLLVVNKQSPISDLNGYIAKAKEGQGALTCASSGVGSAIHMSCELFNIQANTKIRHIPYKGSAAAMTDLLGGHVDSVFDNMPTVAANVRAGQLKALAVTTAKRSPAFPDTPTVTEVLGKPYSVESWFGIFGPAGMDPAVTTAISTQINRALSSENYRRRVEDLGATPPDTAHNSPADFSRFVDSELDKWRMVVDQLQLTME